MGMGWMYLDNLPAAEISSVEVRLDAYVPAYRVDHKPLKRFKKGPYLQRRMKRALTPAPKPVFFKVGRTIIVHPTWWPMIKDSLENSDVSFWQR